MADRGTAERMQGKVREKTPNARQVLGLIALLAGAVAVLAIGGLMLCGVALALVVGVPIFLLFSPILVPVGFVLFLVVSGVVLTVGGFLAFLSFASWVYNYFKGRRPVGADKLEAARQRLLGTAQQAGEKGREYGGYVGSKAQEAAPGA